MDEEQHHDVRSSPEPFVAACRGIVEDVTRPSSLHLTERVYVAVRRRGRWRWVVLLLLAVLLLYVACVVGFRARRARDQWCANRARETLRQFPAPSAPPLKVGGGAEMRGQIPEEIRNALLQ